MVWRWIKWPVLVLGGAYLLLVIWDVNRLFDLEETNQAVAAIHEQKITMADVMGTALPPAPDQAENDATVEGIDKNNNGIRDDVELAIFKKYPNEPRVRAAELQYALAEQRFYSEVENKDVFRAMLQEHARASTCINKVYPSTDVSLLSKAAQEYYFKHDFVRETNRIEVLSKEVELLVFNTQLRMEAKDKAFEFMTGYGDAPGNSCDVDTPAN